MLSKTKFPTISSFFVALSVYIAVIIILFFKLTMFHEPAKRYTDNVDAFIDVVIPEKQEESQELKVSEQKEEIKKEYEKPRESTEEKSKEKTIDKLVLEEELPTPTLPTKESKSKPISDTPAPTITETTKEISKEELMPIKKPDLKNLFSDIDTNKLKSNEKPKEKKVKTQQEHNKNTTRTSTNASDIIKNLKLDKTVSTPNEQKLGDYDPTLGAISKQIERKWRSYKANTNNVADIRVTIDAYGNFSYEITKLPYNSDFNDKVKECLEILRSEKFPFSPNGKPITLNLKLEDKLDIQ